MDDLKESANDSLLTNPEDRVQNKSIYKERNNCRSQPKWTKKTPKRYKQGTKESPKKNHRQPIQSYKPSQISSDQSSSSETSSTSSSNETTERKTTHKQKEARATEKKKEKFRAIYANWMQETTKECRKELQKYKVTNWVNGQRSRQFGMAGHVIRKTDGRWAKALVCLLISKYLFDFLFGDGR